MIGHVVRFMKPYIFLKNIIDRRGRCKRKFDYYTI